VSTALLPERPHFMRIAIGKVISGKVALDGSVIADGTNV